MREVASTSMRADTTERANEETNMATDGSQPLCWNKRGIWTSPGPVALLRRRAMPPVKEMTFPPKYFSSPSGTEPMPSLATTSSSVLERVESSSRGADSCDCTEEA